jgi:hypothetical protein
VRIYQQEADNDGARTPGMSAARFNALREHAASLTGITGTRSQNDLTGLDLFRPQARGHLMERSYSAGSSICSSACGTTDSRPFTDEIFSPTGHCA